VNTLTGYYRRAALKPLAVTAIFGFILSVTHDGSAYKSEYASNDGYVETVVLLALVSASISLLSLTIFLNKSQAIRANNTFSFLTWSALPGALCLLLVYIGLRDPGHDLLLAFVFLIAISHLVSLITTFRHFRMGISRSMVRSNA
jgi:hypothetical protein